MLNGDKKMIPITPKVARGQQFFCIRYANTISREWEPLGKYNNS